MILTFVACCHVGSLLVIDADVFGCFDLVAMLRRFWVTGLITIQAGARPTQGSINVSVDSSIVASRSATAEGSGNIFVPIGSDAPPSQISSRSDHPAQSAGIIKQSSPLYTNKFYANLFLGNQSSPVWTNPYSVVWGKGGGSTKSWGLSVLQTERDTLTYGPDYTPSGAPQFYVNPSGIQQIVISAAELGASTSLTTDTHQAFSVNANLASGPDTAPVISFPLVQGMGFVTGVYNQGTPLLQSGVFFRTLSLVGGVNGDATYKYSIQLEDGSDWLLYATPTEASGAPAFSLVDSKTIQGPSGFSGSIQIAKNPAKASGEASYDLSAGAYAISGSVSGTVNGAIGSYQLGWQKAGSTNQKLLMFALPHHVESMADVMSSAATTIQLETTTKGIATAYLADTMEFTEPNLPVDIGFDPWSPKLGNVKAVSSAAAQAINNAASIELAEDMDKQSNLNSMYYSGKVCRSDILFLVVLTDDRLFPNSHPLSMPANSSAEVQLPPMLV
jgi:endo-1,3(4)-beta-glucanase